MMRIPFNTAYEEGTRALNRAATTLTDAQRQLSSGRRINSPSDDPLGTSTAITEHSTLTRVDAYTRAADAVSARLVLADTALSDIVTQLTAAQSAALSARGSSTTLAQRQAVASELLAIRDSILSDINTQLQGTYLFSGSNVLVAPYAPAGPGLSPYQGDSSTTRIEVNSGRAVEGTFDGGAILQGGDPQHILDALTDLATAITAADANGIANGVAAIERAFDRATLAQSQVGNNLRAVDDVRVQLTAVRTTSVSRLATIEDADLAAVSAQLAQGETAYRAALAALGHSLNLSLLDFMK
jgi:flagellar hook-associated protein 3 FlgL